MLNGDAEPDLEFEQFEILGNFANCTAENPALSFEEVAAKLGIDFSKSMNGDILEAECRDVFDAERGK